MRAPENPIGRPRALPGVERAGRSSGAHFVTNHARDPRPGRVSARRCPPRPVVNDAAINPR